jgi:hypothetical protein
MQSSGTSGRGRQRCGIVSEIQGSGAGHNVVGKIEWAVLSEGEDESQSRHSPTMTGTCCASLFEASAITSKCLRRRKDFDLPVY